LAWVVVIIAHSPWREKNGVIRRGVLPPALHDWLQREAGRGKQHQYGSRSSTCGVVGEGLLGSVPEVTDESNITPGKLRCHRNSSYFEKIRQNIFPFWESSWYPPFGPLWPHSAPHLLCRCFPPRAPLSVLPAHKRTTVRDYTSVTSA
jgi:hypothetical protein